MFNLSQVAILAGRLASEDLGNASSGRTYFSLAADTACEAGDGQLAAIAHGYAAQLTAAEGFTTAALDHLTTAVEHVHRAPAITSWLATTETTIHADRGDDQLAREALQRSRTELDELAEHPAPAWLYEHPADRLAAATGHTLLRADDRNGACKTFTMALDKVYASARRQTCIVTHRSRHRRTAHRQPPRCLRPRHSGSRPPPPTPYATGSARLRGFRAAAAQRMGSPALRALDEQLHQLAA